MTSDLGVGHSVEQSVEQSVERPFLFHCSCGAAIETTAKREICRACGETVEVVRCVATPHGNKYTLRISKHRKSVDAEPVLWPLALQATAPTPSTQHRHRARDQEKKHFLLGLLALLLAAYSMIGLFVPAETLQEWTAFLDPHQPRDCDWITMPVGDKHCHYDSSVRNVRDEKGEHVVVLWRRVND